MKKVELISKVAEEAKVPRAAAERAINAFAKIVTEALTAKEKVSLPGFGTFMVAKRAQRKGRNPRTGKEIMIPEVYVPKFKVGKNLKEAVKAIK
ncbi:MAG: DNA-binding protein HU [Deltaproteobacteria bacterium]|nr:MAG: DNA-binding protein HU [Deltaproteobacteria bacterium]RLA97543.1 MAG: DNA-binding protein HU [Deltaproteobacteria bacterium]